MSVTDEKIEELATILARIAEDDQEITLSDLGEQERRFFLAIAKEVIKATIAKKAENVKP